MKYILLLLMSVILLNAQKNEPVIDKQQHLMWNIYTQETNTDLQFPWKFGKSYCDNSYKYGYDDWRLPTPQELQTSIKNGILKNIRPGSYWTSSPDPKDPEDNVLSVYSSNGYISATDICDDAYSLCVR